MKEKTLAKEMQEHLQKEIPELYPQRFQNYEVVSINYDVILEDIKTYWNQEARFREGFRYDDENQKIYIPNFFTKINGINKNKKEYVEFVRFLRNSKNTYVWEENENVYSMVQVNEKVEEELKSKNANPDSIRDFILNYDNNNNCFEPTVKNILQKKFLCFTIKETVSFDYLVSAKQNLLLSILMKNLTENKFEFNSVYAYKEYISMVFNLNEHFINLINNFDYCSEVPKIVFIKDSISEIESRILDLLNEIGFDIIILSPYGKSNIEKYMDINELSLGYFDTKFDFEKEALTISEQMKINHEERIDKIVDFYNEKQIGECWMGVICSIVSLICLWLIPWGWVNTVIEIIFLIVAISCICILSENYYHIPSAASWTYGLAIALLIGMLIVRGSIALWNVETNPQDGYMTEYNGFQVIEEKEIITENGFVIKTKNDAAISDNSKSLYAYIENNAMNTQTIVFELVIGNSTIYISDELKPLQYVKSFSINTLLPIGNHTVIVKYYNADEYDPYNKDNKNVCIGQNEIIIHVVESENLDKTIEELKLFD